MATCPKCFDHYVNTVTVCPVDGELLVQVRQGDHDLKEGEVVGEYKIEGKIGEGGCGAVYRGFHPLIGKEVAVKVLNQEFSRNPTMVTRFIAEARAVNQIRHQNIIDIFSFGKLPEPDGRQYYVMEFLSGATLDRLLVERGRFTLEDVAPILRGLARALDAAHAKGIAHRDLKPENVFVGTDQEGSYFPKLLDFGIAKTFTGDAPRLTRTGAPIGTPYYMSPEQARGRDVDHRTDIYSFGVMAYQLLTGVLPFDGDYVDLLAKHAGAEPPPPTSVCPDLTEDVDKAIGWMMAKDPAGRPPSLAVALQVLVGRNMKGISIPPPVKISTGPGVSTLLATMPEGRAISSLRGTKVPLPQSTTIVINKRRLRIAIGVIAAGVLGIVGFLGVPRFPTSPPAAPASARAPLVPAQGQAPAAAPAQPAPPAPAQVLPKTVRIRVRGVPPGTEAFDRDGKPLGPAAEFQLGRGDELVRFELRAPGHKSHIEEIVPSSDQSLGLKLEKVTNPKKGGGKKNPGMDDLENPF